MSDDRVPTEQIAADFARSDAGMPPEERFGRLIDLIRDFAEHGSPRCGWPAGYEQWRDGDCPCGLTEALRDAGLPVEWAGGPAVDDAETAT